MAAHDEPLRAPLRLAAIVCAMLACPAGAEEHCEAFEQILDAVPGELLAVVNWGSKSAEPPRAWAQVERGPNAREVGRQSALTLPFQRPGVVRKVLDQQGAGGFAAGTVLYTNSVTSQDQGESTRLYEAALARLAPCLEGWTGRDVTADEYRTQARNFALVKGRHFERADSSAYVRIELTRMKESWWAAGLTVVSPPGKKRRPPRGPAKVAAVTRPAATPATEVTPKAPAAPEPEPRPGPPVRGSFCEVLSAALAASGSKFASVRGKEQQAPLGKAWATTLEFPGAEETLLEQSPSATAPALFVTFVRTSDLAAARKRQEELAAQVSGCKLPCGQLMKNSVAVGGTRATYWIPVGGNAVCSPKLKLDVALRTVPRVDARGEEAVVVLSVRER